MSFSDSKSISREALVLIVERSIPDDMISRHANALRRIASTARGVTVNSFSGRYCCPLEQVFGHSTAEKLCACSPLDPPNAFLNFQSEFDNLMDEYFERSIYDSLGKPYEVYVA